MIQEISNSEALYSPIAGDQRAGTSQGITAPVPLIAQPDGLPQPSAISSIQAPGPIHEAPALVVLPAMREWEQRLSTLLAGIGS